VGGSSRATHLLQAGASIYDVAKLLGDTTATVERVYGHHSCESLGKNLDQFDNG
jgi:integrase